jgi:hypothetical protein
MLNEMIDAEAKASMAAEDGLGPRASSVLPNSYFQPGQRSEAAMEREFDELLRIAKPKTQRNR